MKVGSNLIQVTLLSSAFLLYHFCQASLTTRESCNPYVPGQSGGAWSAEELRIVRRRVRNSTMDKLEDTDMSLGLSAKPTLHNRITQK